MALTYVIILIFFILLGMIVLYILHTFVFPKKIEEIIKMIENGQTRMAIKKLNDILEKDDRNAFAHYLMAEAYSKEDNKKYAVVELRQVLKLGKFTERMKEEEVRIKLARLYIEGKQIEEAKKELLILTKIDPDNYDNFYQLGLIFYNSQALDRALGFFKKSTSINPKHDMSYYYLGQIYYRTNMFPESKQMLIDAIKLDPANYKAHYFLGLVLRQMGDFEWAIKEFEVAQKSDDLKVKCFLAKGSCYIERSHHQKAIMEFERGLKIARKGSDTELNLRYYLADCQEKIRDIHAAIGNWERIIEINSNFKDVQEKLKNYSEFRQDDRIKDFLIHGLSQFEHQSRKIVESLGYRITDIEIINDTDIEIIATDFDSKWRNTRQTNKLIRINRTTDIIGEKLLRTLHENMKNKNVTRVIIITTAEFSPQAVDFANTRPIELHGKSDLIDILKKI